MKYHSDGAVAKVLVEDGNIEITAKSGYCEGVDDLCTLCDNGNGYYVTFYSYRSTEPNHILNLDYAELEMLHYAYKAILKKEKKEANYECRN